MVGRSALLCRVEALGPARHRRSRCVAIEPYLSGCALPFMEGDRKFQSCSLSDCICNFPGSGVIRAPYDPIWLWISGRIADCAAAIPPETASSAMDDPTHVLSMGEYARIVVSGDDRFHHDRCRWPCTSALG